MPGGLRRPKRRPVRRTLPEDRARVVDILYLLIPLSLVLVLLIGAVFWWSLRSGQFDDLDAAGRSILDDED